jgi:hypothetical protein
MHINPTVLKWLVFISLELGSLDQNPSERESVEDLDLIGYETKMISQI